MTADNTRFDVLLWGATGFTGQITAEYLLERYGVQGDLHWALGGRNPAKLEAVRRAIGQQVGVDATSLPIVVGDASDSDSVNELAQSTRVVCTTVGPYALYGSPLVAACAREGTHYCDLTGEIHWVRNMIDAHQKQAVESGARLVPSSGFDCIPSDLGVFFLQREMQRRHGVSCSEIKLGVEGFSGGVSGGTAASMLAMLEESAANPDIGRMMNDPYGLNPSGQVAPPTAADRVAPSFDSDFDQWTAPFMMARINTRVVRRSNALLNHLYGEDFIYDEATLTGQGLAGCAKAAGVAAGTKSGEWALSVGPLRNLIKGRMPQPGEGPSREQREKGFFDLRLFGRHPTDRIKNLWCRVYGDRDPGYGSTAKMLGETAVCLALDPQKVGGGFWTPASALGEPLLARLEANAGVSFTMETD